MGNGFDNVKMPVCAEFMHMIKGAHEKTEDLIKISNHELITNVFIEHIVNNIELQSQITQPENVSSKKRVFMVSGCDFINYMNARLGTILLESDTRFMITAIIDHINKKGDGKNNLMSVEFKKNDALITIHMEALKDWGETPQRFKSYHTNKFTEGLESEVVRSVDL